MFGSAGPSRVRVAMLGWGLLGCEEAIARRLREVAVSEVLKGIRVLDFGRYIAGPFCAALLADFGAEVIRIDKLGGSEDRWTGPVGADGTGAAYMQMNRNKLG